MANKKLTQLTDLTNPKADKCVLYTVDKNDTTDGVGGTSKKVTARTLIEGNIPTPTELSAPGALQEYITSSLQRTGICQLPRGIITIPNGEKITLNRVHSGIIRGAGQAYAPTGSGSQWINPTNGIRAYTIIRKTGGSSEVFYLYGTNNLTLEHFSVENPNRYCFKYTTEYIGSYTANYLKMNQVGGLDCSVFFHAYSAENNNAADVNFSGCMFNQCDVVLKVDHNQGMNWHFEKQCYFLQTEIAVLLKGGGRVVLDNCCGHTVKTWIRADQGGGNIMPTCIINNLYSDRPTPPNTPPVIVDFSRATGPVNAIVDGFNVTDGDGEYGPNFPNSGHPLFIAPTGAGALYYWTKPTGTLRGGIVVRDIDFCAFPRTFNPDPVSTTNPWGDQGFA